MDEKWTFITNHGLVLSHIAQNPKITAREIALTVGITERTTHKIITDLEQSNYISKTRIGRRNIYEVNFRNHLRHHSKKDIEVSTILQALNVSFDKAGFPDLKVITYQHEGDFKSSVYSLYPQVPDFKLINFDLGLDKNSLSPNFYYLWMP